MSYFPDDFPEPTIAQKTFHKPPLGYSYRWDNLDEATKSKIEKWVLRHSKFNNWQHPGETARPITLRVLFDPPDQPKDMVLPESSLEAIAIIDSKNTGK